MRIFIALFLGVFSVMSNAQTASVSSWTLQSCIDYALNKNISIQQNIKQGEIAENNLLASKLSRVPTLNASGNHNYNIGRSIDPFTNTFNTTTLQTNSFSLSAGVMLYGGNRINNTIKLNDLTTKVNEQGTEVIKNQIALAVANTFLSIVQGEESLKIALAQKELTASQLERAKKLVASGSSNQSAVLNLEAQIANDEVQIVNAKNAIQIAYNSLMNLMQWDMTADFEIAVPSIAAVPAFPATSVAMVYEAALSQLPEIKQAEITVDQSMLNEKIASASLMPSLSAYGNLNTIYSDKAFDAVFTGFELEEIGITETSNELVYAPDPQFTLNKVAFGKQLADNLGQSFGVSLSVPIFNGYRNKMNVENAKVNTEISTLGLESTKNQVRADVTTAYTNLKAAKSRYDASLASEIAQEKNFEFSQARFDAGMMNSVDLLNAKNMWFQSQINTTNSKYEYIFRNLIIEFYQGNPLKL